MASARFPSVIIALLLALLGIFPGSAKPLYAQQTAASHASWVANEDDSWLFELRTGRWTLGEGVRGYKTPTGMCLDLADVIMALDVPIRLDRKSRRATGWAFDERNTIEIDRDAGKVVAAGRIEAIRADMIHDTPEGWCVATTALARWLGVGLDVDLSNSSITVTSDHKLPFELQSERKERAARIRPKVQFDLAKLPEAKRKYEFFEMPSIDVALGAAIVDTPRTGRYAHARYDIFASGEIGKTSFDARLASNNSYRPRSLHVRAYRSDPAGKLLGPLQATHAAIGDVSMVATPMVARGVLGRGAVVTNRPLEQPDSFDRTSFRGELPSGWDAELYRNGQLLAFATPSGDGRYAFLDVPLLYGGNRFEVILYGPQGQIRREHKFVPVGAESIPPKKTYYWAGIVQENHDLLSLTKYEGLYKRGWRGSIGIERGLNTRTSIAGYAHSMLYENQRLTFVEAALRRSVGPALLEFSGSMEARGGLALRGQLLSQFGETHVRAETMWGFNGYISERIERNIKSLHTISADHNISLGAAVVPLQASANYVVRRNGSRTLEVAARASTGLRRLSLTGELRYRAALDSLGGHQSDDMIASLLANARFGKLMVRGEGRVSLSGNRNEDRLNIVAELPKSPNTNWRGELGYERGADRFRIGAGITRHFREISVTALAEVATDRSFGANITAAFSIGPDPRNGRMRFSRDRLATQGHVVGRVFRDNNADGIWQPGEPLEKNVTLTGGPGSDMPTDAGGRAIIDGLTPFRPVLIGVDAGSLSDPFVQPALPGKVIVPRPGVSTLVELPLVGSGEIEGKLVSANGSDLVGVDLELIDDKGRSRQISRSDFDGYFLFDAVPYGHYTMRVSALSAQAARIDGALDATARLDAQSPRAMVGVVTARAATIAADETTGSLTVARQETPAAALAPITP